MINFSKEQRNRFRNLEMNVENLVKNFEAEPNDKGKEFQKIEDISVENGKIYVYDFATLVLY